MNIVLSLSISAAELRLAPSRDWSSSSAVKSRSNLFLSASFNFKFRVSG